MKFPLYWRRSLASGNGFYKKKLWSWQKVLDKLLASLFLIRSTLEMMNYTCCWVKQVPVRLPIWCSQIKIYEQAPLIELVLSQFQLDFFSLRLFFALDILWIFWSLKTHFKSIKFKITQFYKLYVVIKSADVLFFHLLVILTWYALYYMYISE